MIFRESDEGAQEAVEETVETTESKNETRRRELVRIEREHGKLTPALIVDEARLESSPLHDWFEWDDDAAAEAFREAQARRLVRFVYVRDVDDGTRTPAFYHVTTEEAEACYVSACRLRSDDDLFDSALRELTLKLRLAAASVEKLSKLRDVSRLDQVRKLVARALSALEKIGR